MPRWKTTKNILVDNQEYFDETWMNYDSITQYMPPNPKWFGNNKFHSSHRANLLKKEPEFYVQYGWTEDPMDPYVWVDKEGKWYEQHSGKQGRVYF